eukprot:COSAG01_NODE_7406_length_3218_cov_3.756168_1_plen_290_part_00
MDGCAGGPQLADDARARARNHTQHKAPPLSAPLTLNRRPPDTVRAPWPPPPLLWLTTATAAHRCCRCRCRRCLQMEATADKKLTTIADVCPASIGNIVRCTQILQQMAQDPAYRARWQQQTNATARETVIVYNHLAAIFRAPTEPVAPAPVAYTPQEIELDTLGEHEPGMTRWRMSAWYEASVQVDVPADIDPREADCHLLYNHMYINTEDGHAPFECNSARTIFINDAFDIEVEDQVEPAALSSKILPTAAPATATEPAPPSAEPVDAPARPVKKAKVCPIPSIERYH